MPFVWGWDLAHPSLRTSGTSSKRRLLFANISKSTGKTRKDMDSKFCVILIKSRIHHLARYDKTKQQIAPTFKHDSATASTLIA
ncbi:ribosomal 40S subunit protein S13 [Stygiomarasmius scandens]|uniref:Ribosomal 40S subunit protein S13 n=1 Tax=Marasmiellus scandens TaxID=2682957 RepID=A0ABR1J2L3_9AGAR